MRTIIFTLFVAAALAAAAGIWHPAVAATGAEPRVVPALEIAANAPERHVVVPGDTLWGIAGKFLKDPYRWNELFRLNRNEIRNPQRIYPGQVLVLERDGGTPRLRVESVKLSPTMRSDVIDKPIWTVSPEKIAPFLGKPLVVEDGGLDSAPRVVGVQDNRVVAGARDRVFVTNATAGVREWQIFRPGEALTDPVSGEILGHEALYLGTARQVREGQPADFVITTSTREIQAGDRLLPAPRNDIVDYSPHSAPAGLAGLVVGTGEGVAYAGRDQVVTISRGRSDGLEPGHVLATDRSGDIVDDRFKGEKTTLQMPDQRNGLLLIFRVFDRVSYALVLEAARAVQRGDRVRAP